jgi:hypothetical protein
VHAGRRPFAAAYPSRRLNMGDRGSKDRAGREKKKKAKHTLKEKRKIKHEKKQSSNSTGI